MKKILILLLILLPIVNAQDISISLSKDNYYQYETLQAEIFINLSVIGKITSSNFNLINEDNVKIPVPIFLEEISDNHYFVYFDIPELNNGTYYFLVKDIWYSDILLKKTSKSQKFYLDEIKSISIYPAILNKLNSANLQMINKAQPINITIESDILNISKKILLDKKINYYFDIPKNIDKFNIKINYDHRNYLIPVIPYQEENVENMIMEETKQLIIPIQKKEITLLNSTFGTHFVDKIELANDSSRSGPFYIKNTGTLSINLTFHLTGDLNYITRLNLTLLNNFNPGENLTQYIWLNENKNPSKKVYFGGIEIRSDKEIVKILPLKIEILEENSLIEEKVKKDNKTEINLIKNNSKQEITKADDNKNKNLITYFVIILIIISILIYFIFKKKKEENEFNKFLKNL
jgi:hypothetical protein